MNVKILNYFLLNLNTLTHLAREDLFYNGLKMRSESGKV